jgi:protein-tyrosine phosphatase
MAEVNVQRVYDGQIKGAVNLRDIGGYPAGDCRVRWGRVYRSGLTHAITPAGLAAFAQELGVRTVIDLRTPAEVDGGLAPFADHQIRHVHASVIEAVTLPASDQIARVMAMYDGSDDWAERYAGMLRAAPEVFRQVFEAMAEPAALPAVVHCSGGRDRTGVTIALLLRVLGVAPETIAEDYALTGDLLAPHVHHFAGFAQAGGLTVEQMALLVRTSPAPMLAFLDHLEATYGSADAFLLQAGVQPGALATLRDLLLDR